MSLRSISSCLSGETRILGTSSSSWMCCALFQSSRSTPCRAFSNCVVLRCSFLYASWRCSYVILSFSLISSSFSCCSLCMAYSYSSLSFCCACWVFYSCRSSSSTHCRNTISLAMDTSKALFTSFWSFHWDSSFLMWLWFLSNICSPVCWKWTRVFRKLHSW